MAQYCKSNIYRRIPPLYRVISIILILAFLAYDIAWAYPDNNRNTLAVTGLQNKKAIARLKAGFLIDLIDKNISQKGSAAQNLVGLLVWLRPLLEGFKEFEIKAVLAPDKSAVQEVRIHLDSERIIVRYYDAPNKPQDIPGYQDITDNLQIASQISPNAPIRRQVLKAQTVSDSKLDGKTVDGPIKTETWDDWKKAVGEISDARKKDLGEFYLTVRKILELLESNDLHLRSGAAEALGGLVQVKGYRELAKDKILELLKSDDPYLRSGAARALGGLDKAYGSDRLAIDISKLFVGKKEGTPFKFVIYKDEFAFIHLAIAELLQNGGDVSRFETLYSKDTKRFSLEDRLDTFEFLNRNWDLFSTEEAASLRALIETHGLLNLLDSEGRPNRGVTFKKGDFNKFIPRFARFAIEKYRDSSQEKWHAPVFACESIGAYSVTPEAYLSFQQSLGAHYAKTGGVSFTVKTPTPIVVTRFGMLGEPDLNEIKKRKIPQGLKVELSQPDRAIPDTKETLFGRLGDGSLVTERKKIPLSVNVDYYTRRASQQMVLDPQTGDLFEVRFIGSSDDATRAFYEIGGEVVSLCINIPLTRNMLIPSKAAYLLKLLLNGNSRLRDGEKEALR
ncbi:MAG: hypothetical protein Q8R31_00060, partial [Candidatus Omnitrophota bacterium]|nr:hypothetical protein [Candidatus Omnitrophota bacterium]